MRIIIFEGIATSGKTTVKSKVAEILHQNGLSFSIIEEDKTLMPVLDNNDKQASLNLLKEVITNALKGNKDFILFDRLFFTHIFRTNSSVEDFEEIENMIKDNSLIVFLKIDEEKIPERILIARKHRDKQWNDYVSKKGTDKEIKEYYINQQKILLGMLNQTSLNFKIFNTSNMDFDGISNEIIGILIGKQ